MGRLVIQIPYRSTCELVNQLDDLGTGWVSDPNVHTGFHAAIFAVSMHVVPRCSYSRGAHMRYDLSIYELVYHGCSKIA